MTLLALIGALSLASIPIMIGWRQGVKESEMARQMGLSTPKRRFDPENFARQTGTGLAFNQIAIAFVAWVIGGFVAGLLMGGFLAAIMFSIAGGLLYAGTLSSRRQEFRLSQAKDTLRGLGIIETLLGQSRPLTESLESATDSLGPDGKLVFSDLVRRLRDAPVETEKQADAVRAWTQAWDNPAVDIVGTTLITHFTASVQIAPLVSQLRVTLSGIVEILSRARAAAKGVEWQAKFLALFPPGVMLMTAITTPEMGALYAASPWLLLPIIIGSGLSYFLSIRMIKNGLSMEASMGLQAGRLGEINLNDMGHI